MRYFKEIRSLYLLNQAIEKDPNSIVFLSEGGMYFRFFEGYIRYLLKHTNINLLYITADIEDPTFNEKNERFQVFYLRNLAPQAIENLKAKVIVMTVTELDNGFLKRSKHGANHVYAFHSMGSISMYKKGSFDNYDTMLCIGPTHAKELREIEELYNTKRKTLIETGFSWLETLYTEGRKRPHNGSILVAPSWYEGCFFDTCFDEALPILSKLGKPVIIRPHAEFLKRFPEKVKRIKKKLETVSNITFESNAGNRDSIMNAELLITDWSNICLEFALGLERPVLFLNTPQRADNPDYAKISTPPLDITHRDCLGGSVNLNEISTIGTAIQKILGNKEDFKKNIAKIRNELLYNWLHAGESGGKYLQSLVEQRSENHEMEKDLGKQSRSA